MGHHFHFQIRVLIFLQNIFDHIKIKITQENVVANNPQRYLQSVKCNVYEKSIKSLSTKQHIYFKGRQGYKHEIKKKCVVGFDDLYFSCNLRPMKL